MREIDARGLACPQPVILTKRALDAGDRTLLVRVDNRAAVENLKRLAAREGCTVTVEGGGSDFALTLTGAGEPAPDRTAEAESPAAGTGAWALLVGHDTLGDGDRTLGTNLIRMYFYTLAQEENLPGAIIFLNGGVKLPTLDEQVVAHLHELEQRGVEVLVCGTCLSYYELMDSLKAGSVSNMYDIVTTLGRYGKVVTL